MKELRLRRKSIQREAVSKIDQEWEELFDDLKEVQDAVRKELAQKTESNNFDPKEEHLIMDDYLSDEEETDEKMEDKEEEEDHSLRVLSVV